MFVSPCGPEGNGDLLVSVEVGGKWKDSSTVLRERKEDSVATDR